MEQQDPEQEHIPIKSDPSFYLESNVTMQNSSFASFVNPVDSQPDEEEPDFEIVFHNESLLKLLGKKEGPDLNEFVRKPVFAHKELK